MWFNFSSVTTSCLLLCIHGRCSPSCLMLWSWMVGIWDEGCSSFYLFMICEAEIYLIMILFQNISDLDFECSQVEDRSILPFWLKIDPLSQKLPSHPPWLIRGGSIDPFHSYLHAAISALLCVIGSSWLHFAQGICFGSEPDSALRFIKVWW